MTHGERILNAVDPDKAVASLTDHELVALIDELSERTWWNGFWTAIATLTTEEAMARFCAFTSKTPKQ